MSKFNGFFKDWAISKYNATHNDGRKLWIASGLSFFKDESHSVATLMGFNRFERYQLWQELKKEVKRRNLKGLG